MHFQINNSISEVLKDNIATILSNSRPYAGFN